MKNSVAAVILAAGKGTRMKSDLPKALMPICGKPMIRHIINTFEGMGIKEIIPVIAPDQEIIAEEVAPYKTAVQEKQLGTGHAVLSAREMLKGFAGKIIVAYGDHPIITGKTFQKVLDKLDDGYAVVFVGFRPEDSLRYGRLKMQGDELVDIIEFKDATDEEKQINFCNSGVVAFNGSKMFELLDGVGNENAAGEYYLTDVVKVARKKGLKSSAIECGTEEVAGANTLEELAALEGYLKKRQGK
ncbi:MAG: NTP transferase domain-containing protein [Lactobacillaceae bacterium]|jgi:bifunctional UDP-N-acetylglucosamine pyrophosphorylase/glucosamine-1-phosphate N-acetyltransferase|nr:NTP transferase domain-containing protein [Lactobacillaceae bacterium]